MIRSQSAIGVSQGSRKACRLGSTVARLNLRAEKSSRLLAVHLKELAGEHHKGGSLRFNWSQRQETYQERQKVESQAEEFTLRDERGGMAAASSVLGASV